MWANPCPVCDEKQADNFRIFFDGYMKLYECKKCHFIADYPGPGESARVESYEDLKFDDTECKYMYPERMGGIKDIAERIYNKKQKGKFLDVGCGDGYLLSLMEEKGFSCYGVEESKSLSQRASLNSGAIIKNNRYSTEMFDDESFDVISFIQVVEHIPQPLPVLQTAYRHLKKGGLIVIEVPSARSPQFLLYMLTMLKMFVKPPHGVAPYHCSYFTAEPMSLLAERAGFNKDELITGRWQYKYQGLKRILGRTIDPILNYTRIGGILYFGLK